MNDASVHNISVYIFININLCMVPLGMFVQYIKFVVDVRSRKECSCANGLIIPPSTVVAGGIIFYC